MGLNGISFIVNELWCYPVVYFIAKPKVSKEPAVTFCEKKQK